VQVALLQVATRQEVSTRITVFTFGYWGWGTATERLVQVVDAAEEARGFRPPRFVDVRIRRAGRAPGFQGNAFGELLGPERYRWMPALGNRFVETRRGPICQIAEPQAAEQLLEAAIDAGRQGRRVIFYCACQWPMHGAELGCHRREVATLLLAAARRRSVPLEVVEWPGGRPAQRALSFEPVKLLGRRSKSIRLSPDVRLAEVAALPWASLARIGAGSEARHCLVGPPQWQGGGWSLPIVSDGSSAEPAALRREAQRFRRYHGLEARKA
jgi:hypothetical protein